MRNRAQQLLKDGNFQDALAAYRKLLADPQSDARQTPGDLSSAATCLSNLGAVDDLDDLLAKAVDVHANNWRLLAEAARQWINADHLGYLIAGKFSRGHRRGGGEYVNCIDRDRVQALRLLTQALPLVARETNQKDVAPFYLQFAEAVQFGAGGADAWELQQLTNWHETPDFQPGYRWGRRGVGSVRGAPVDADGNPVYYRIPKSFAEAQSDGERWRWLLTQAVECDAALRNQVEWTWASFLHAQFGVQTMANALNRGFNPADDKLDEATGPFAVQTLKDEETIARLADGVRKFTLPDEFNALKLYQALATRGNDSHAASGADALADAYEDRRQYVKAAAAWKSALAKFGDENHRQQRLMQIVGNWATFENAELQPAGQGATVDLRFRNAMKVTFTAHAIRIPQLLDDVKAYLKSSPNQLDWQRFNISDVGYRLVVENQAKYIGEKVADWSLELEPRPEHGDRRITVATPLQKAGAYLLEAKLPNGNTSRIVLWLADTAIVKKQLDGQAWYFVADAVTGKPLPRVNLEFFGWKQEQVRPNQNQYRVVTKNFAELTDADGQVRTAEVRQPQDHQWLSIARTDTGRLAYLGFTGVWYGRYHDQQYQETKVYTITDRPVYRPAQVVKYKFWIGNAQYDQPDQSPFANTDCTVIIVNPRGETVLEKPVRTDAFGGLDGEFPLAKDAPLGVYHLALKDRGGQSSFRVEEYKKPEFEVTVEAPQDPVQLGEKIVATIQSKYYFGAPVVKAKVKYKIERTSHAAAWYPPGRWDWFYGKGYWWFASDYAWYPGWRNWGCVRPAPWWWRRAPEQPELVAEQEVEIGPDGKLPIEIDTRAAQELHGDQDHAYQITAEVTDESRRTVVGLGTALVARKPFQVFAWLDRGHYKVGDVVQAHFSAFTLDQKPVTGAGKLTLFAIKYDDQSRPIETAVQSWELNANALGEAQQQFQAAAAGQYRLSYQLADAQNHTIEGGYVFVVLGPGFNGREFHFNDLELVTDKREYAPGDKVQLLVTTNKPDSTVVLFLRPSNGMYLPPQVLRLVGKSMVAEVAVVPKDMPNFFIEAFTLADGKYHQEAREVVVPPEKRVINVAVKPSQTEYQPGQPATVQVTLTDGQGKPFVGSTVLTVYDRSVDYIAGGSNVPEIREFFWKWRRSHDPRHETNLGITTGNLLKPNEVGMSTLGAFGEVGVLEEATKSIGEGRFTGSKARALHRGLGAVTRSAMASEPAAAAPMAAAADGVMFKGAASYFADAPAGGAAPALVEPAVRSHFADTAYWIASLTTDADGQATVKFDMPENLTGWRVKAWALGAGTKVGEGSAEVTTKKNLLVRLQAPRFFVEKDEVVLSANIHNYLATDKPVKALLSFEGDSLQIIDDPATSLVVKAGEEARVDWRVNVVKEGTAVVRVRALTDEESDAMEMTFPAYVHGMLKTASFSGAIRPKDHSGKLTFTVPADRRINESRLEIRYSPTLAGAMVDALPYLADYPYGCTEQTLNRFLPTVMTQKILQRMQLDLTAIKDKRTNLNAQELGDPAARAKQWKRFDRNPVFDADEVTAMVKDGVERLTSMQLADGGWGWFSGYGEHSYPHTTAVVVHGLQLAKQNDVALVPGVLERGIDWLKRYQNEQVTQLKNFVAKKEKEPQKAFADALDAFVYMALVDADVADADMNAFLFRDRTHLPVYAKALFGLALVKEQQADKLDMILQNIGQFLVQDDENQTAHLKLPEDNWWWNWYGSDVEANAHFLKLLAKVNPQDERAPRLVKYLLNNRKHGTYWNSTRDTAYCIEALAEYLVASGEAEPKLTIEVWLDGELRKTVSVDQSTLFTFDNTFALFGDAVTAGEHMLELRKAGAGPLYFNAYQTNFTLEDFITQAGLEVKVQRTVYKLTMVDKAVDVAGSRGQAAKQKIEKFERTELKNLATLQSGDLVEVELEIDSKNDYEYLVFEDMKAAGFEPVDLRSGYTRNALGAYVEFRDERAAFFVRQLPRGKHSVSYRLRAEIPGQFSALPTKASAMYAPELHGNSDEIKLKIVDR